MEGARIDEVQRSWRKVHEAMKGHEQELRLFMANATAVVRELDGMFTDSSVISASRYESDPAPPKQGGQGQPPAKMSEAEALGMSELFAFPQGEAAFPDMEKTPPLLAGKWATGEAIVGRYSNSSLELPARIYPAQFVACAEDDPAASDEENRLWREAVMLITESLESLHLEAEGCLAAVSAAEERAERRRGPVIEAFRKRVLQQMIYATDGIHKPDTLDEWLTTLQVDPRMLRYLGLLERSALRAEELQAAIRSWQQEEQEAPEGSARRARAREALRETFDKTKGLDVRIRACCKAAEEMPETLDAYEKLGDAWNSMNPFNIFR